MSTVVKDILLRRRQASYRRLGANSRAAMMAAIEIYNKPSFAYRDECFVILALNAWELLLKALLAKSFHRIFYPTHSGETRRSFSLHDALLRSQQLWPVEVPYLPASENIRLLILFRDNAVHLYNKPRFGAIVYGLAQTNIVNYRDLLMAAFGVDLSSFITIEILPLGLRPPIDPIEYFRNAKQGNQVRNSAISRFLLEFSKALDNVEKAGADTGRLMTVYRTKLESVKKISAADLVVGVTSPSSDASAVVVERRVDPNVTHPLRLKDVVQAVGPVATRFTPVFVIQAVVWKYAIRQNIRYCWRSTEGLLTKYSRDFVEFVKSLPPNDVEAAVDSYRDQFRASTRSATRPR